ncbi:HD-GYP domain-containing protein [Fictibacillus iocasae]|uniref:HD-GYP domain-containing protein n=1 Tax=Fictibacillus iocasae TaxID=2715437 RepID=A0ABW2NTX4_9BACL
MKRNLIIAQIFIILSSIIQVLNHLFVQPMDNFLPFILLFTIGFLPAYLLDKLLPSLTKYIFVFNSLYMVCLAFYFVKLPIVESAFFFLPVTALLMNDKRVYLASGISGLAAYLILSDTSVEDRIMFVSIYIIFIMLLTLVQYRVEKNIAEKEAIQQGIKAISIAVEAKDVYTQGHARRVAQYSLILAKHMKKHRVDFAELELTGVLHDIGKISMPDSVLLKDGKLTQDEYEIMKKHPVEGMHLAKSLGFSHKVLSGILHHHERYDGKGYPHGLAGESIPLYSRILAVADSFDAMTSSRSYRSAMTPWDAKVEIERNNGLMYDPEIVDVFKQAYEELLLVHETNQQQKPEPQETIIS